jgi:hypothetical protein
MPKRRDMVVFPIRVQRSTARRVRALAKIYDVTPSEFGRDLLEAVVGGNQRLMLEFVGKLTEAMMRFGNKPIAVGGEDAGLFTAPGQMVKEARAQLREEKGALNT